MDFKSLNRRELQSLCKLNKIPANITNVAMADALKSLDTVVGIEEILNSSRSETARSSVECSKMDEVTSPRAPCTSYRTATCKKVKKSEKESQFATASRAGRGVRRQLAGEGNDFLKTPSVSGARKKGATTMQRVYNTRRSARLSEKKCNEQGVTERGICQPVRIVSFLEEVSVASETSVGSGFSSVETSYESSISFENTEDDAGEESVENCDEGILKAKVKDVCIEFEKLDVIEKVDFCDENVSLEDKQKVNEKFNLNGRETFEEKNDQVDNIKPYSKGISNPIESVNLEENLLVVDEKVDPDEALNALAMEENDYLASEEHSVSFPCDKDLSETGGINADSISCDIENPSDPSASVSDVKNEMDLYEDLVPDEHSDNLFSNVVISSDYFESDPNLVIGKADCCENVDLEGKQKVEERFILNESETSEEKSNEIDNLKPYSEGILSPCENVELEEKLMVVDTQIDPHEVLHVSVMEQNDCLASEEHSDSLLCDKVLSGEKETDGTNADSISCDIENPNDPSMSVSDVKNGIDLYEDLNVSLKTHSVYLAPDEHSDNLFCDVVLSSDYFESDQNSTIEKAECCGENVNSEEKQKVEEKFNLKESETSEEKSNKIDYIKPCSEGISNPHENVDLEEKLRVVDKESDPHEELQVSVMEQNDYLASEEHSANLQPDKVLSETDGTYVDSISCDIVNQNDPSGSVSDVKSEINLYEELNASLKRHNVNLAPHEHSNSLFSDTVLSDAEASCADSISCETENPSDFLGSVLNVSNEILECDGSTYYLENASEMSKLDSADGHNAPEKMTAEAERIEVNIFTNTVDDALVNPNEQEPSKDSETPEEAYESLIKETVVDKLPTIYQETDKTKADVDKETHAPPHDVINHPSHLIPNKNQTSNNIEVSDPNENSVVEDDKIIIKKAEDEKLINLNEISMRQLKKQLKALSIKNNMNTNKYDMVVEARPVLQVVCDNHLTTGDEN